MANTNIIWDLQDRYLDEAEFLFGQWRRALVSPLYTLDEVAGSIESRLLAFLDALVIGGEQVAEHVLWPTLSAPDYHDDRRIAASLALLDSGGQQAADRLLELTGQDPQRRPALIRALHLNHQPWVEPWLQARLADDREHARTTAILTLAAKRARLEPKQLDELLGSDDTNIRVAAATLAGSCDHPAVERRLLELAGTDDEPRVRRAAISSGVTRAKPAFDELAREHAFGSERSAFRADAMVWAALADAPGTERALVDMLGTDEPRGHVLWALSHSGKVAAVDAALELDDEAVHHLVGEVVTEIAGPPMTKQYWQQTRPVDSFASEVPELDDDALDIELVPDSSEYLELPRRAEIDAWWTANRSRLDERACWLRGSPRTPSTIASALAHGPMRRRPVLVLAANRAGCPVPDPQQWTSRQRVHPT